MLAKSPTKSLVFLAEYIQGSSWCPAGLPLPPKKDVSPTNQTGCDRHVAYGELECHKGKRSIVHQHTSSGDEAQFRAQESEEEEVGGQAYPIQ